jgi:hypothetical protein
MRDLGFIVSPSMVAHNLAAGAANVKRPIIINSFYCDGSAAILVMLIAGATDPN